MRRFAGVVVVGLAAALAPAARAQDRRLEERAISVEAGREAVWRFLTQGEAAPRPELTRAELEEARTRVVESPGFLGGASRIVSFRGFELRVAPDGTVHEYMDGVRFPRVLDLAPDKRRRTQEEKDAEVAERTHFDVPTLRERALAFMRGRYPDFAGRVFVESEWWRSRCELMHVFVFFERPGPGQLAVFHNSVSVELSAETGEVTRYLASNVRAVVTELPPVDEATARARARAARPGLEVSSSRLGFSFSGGAPRPVWIVKLTRAGEYVGLVDIDANDGSVRVQDGY